MTVLNGSKLDVTVPTPLCGYVSAFTTCDVTPHELDLFETALSCVAAELLESGFDFPKVPVNCFFIASDQLTFDIADRPDQYGNHFVSIFYPVNRWRKDRLTDLVILTCCLEELCHHFFATHDEVLVNDYVLACAHHHNPNLRYHDLYKAP